MLSASEKELLFLKYEEFARKQRKEYPYGWYEGVVAWDGTIIVATVSHVTTLIHLYGKTEDEVWQEMPVWESPMYWLSEKTKAILTYEVGYLQPRFDMSDAQKYVLSLLVKGHFIQNKAL